eukprot:4972301-Amphidinium_carterae.1
MKDSYVSRYYFLRSGCRSHHKRGQAICLTDVNLIYELLESVGWFLRPCSATQRNLLVSRLLDQVGQRRSQ